MICKAVKGTSARGLFEYLLRDGRGHILPISPMAGRNPRELAAEFGQYRKLNPKLRKAVAHFSLSPSPNDPPLSEVAWEMLAASFMRQMGFGDAAWVVVLHQEPGHLPHAHIAACRIDAGGKTITDANDFRRAEAAVRNIEAEFGLVAVPSSHTKSAKDPRSPPRPRRKTKTTNLKETAMQEHTTPTASPTPPENPFQAGTALHAVWPQPYSLGAVLAEYGMVKRSDATVPGAYAAQHMQDKQRKHIRRITSDPAYEQIVKQSLGDQLAWISKTEVGPVLFFRDAGQIVDGGDNLVTLGGMDDVLAAKRIVAMAIHPQRGWKSITFTGSPSFLDLAFREALDHNLPIHTAGEQQAVILAKIMAERAGGMGATTGPAQNITEILKELDDLPPQTVPRTAPQPVPVMAPQAPTPAPTPKAPQPIPAPFKGVAPLHLNLPERLQDRRQRPTPVKLGPATPPTPMQSGPKTP
jgi:hypothetical protein